MRCGHTRLHDKCADCMALQKQWYEKIEADGFEEIENVTDAKRPLKASMGVSLEEIVNVFVPVEPLQTAFPQSHLTACERFSHHPDFNDICRRICRHGNHKLTSVGVARIWALYIDGNSNRVIGGILAVNDSLVWRTIRSVVQWMNLMDLDATEEPQTRAKVILRDFDAVNDQAFLFASWRNALWYDDDDRQEGDSDRFYKQATASIRLLLDNPKTKVRVACLKDNPGLIIGYSVITELCLHFVYVKADYRNKRIGSLLVPRAVDKCSPVLTKIGRAIAIKRGFIKKNEAKENGKGENRIDRRTRDSDSDCS